MGWALPADAVWGVLVASGIGGAMAKGGVLEARPKEGATALGHVLGIGS